MNRNYTDGYHVSKINHAKKTKELWKISLRPGVVVVSAERSIGKKEAIDFLIAIKSFRSTP